MGDDVKNINDQVSDGEKWFDELIEWAKTHPEGPAVSVSNPERVLQVNIAYDALKKALKGRNLKITKKMNKPFKNMAAISIEGKSIEFPHGEYIRWIIERTDNIEVYPLTTGNLRMTFTFYGLTKRV